MFPPNLRNAVDGLPIGAQIAVYAAVFIFTIAVLGASVAWSRKREKAVDPNNVLLPGYASIADMRPVRDVADMLREVVDVNRDMLKALEKIEDHLADIKTQILIVRETTRK